MASTTETSFGTFKRPSDGKTLIASTIDDAVRWRYAGWKEVKPPTKDAAEQMQAAEEPQDEP